MARELLQKCAAWHRHPLGQTPIVTGAAAESSVKADRSAGIRPGDVIWFAPGEKHWHEQRRPQQ